MRCRCQVAVTVSRRSSQEGQYLVSSFRVNTCSQAAQQQNMTTLHKVTFRGQSWEHEIIVSTSMVTLRGGITRGKHLPANYITQSG
jgi:hypothetical protein